MSDGAVATTMTADSGEQPLAVDVLGSAALVVYSIVASVSFAALVFTGPASTGLADGASTFLLASGVITVFLGLRSRFKVAFGVVQDTAAIVLVPAVATIAANGSDDPVRDVFVVLAVSAALTGVLMWLLGRTGLSSAARFMPTTVVAGFLAGTGWLLAKGGFDVMTGRSLGLGDLDDLASFDLARLWLPGLALGAVITIVPLIRRLSPIVSTITTIASIGVFFAVVAATSSVAAVESGGWLLGPFPESGSIRFVATDAAASDWSAIGATVPQIGVVVILSLLGVLLNIAGIQSLVRRRIDLDAELQTVGLANVIVAPIGGLVGYHGLGDSTLAERLGVRRRWTPLAVGMCTAGFAFAGSSIVGYLPKFVAGGLLIGAGLGLLVSWLQELRSTTAWSDRLVSIVILAVICFVGILEGIVVGVIAACLFFVARYSRIDAVRVISTGFDRRSVVQRPVADVATLDEVAGKLVVYELHGSLFFGSVTGVAETVRPRLARSGAPLDVVIVDFARVTDIDSSAYAVLSELADEVRVAGVRLIWADLPAGAAGVLARNADGGLDEAADLDRALETAEDHLLAFAERRGADEPGDDGSEEAEAGYSAALLDFFAVRHHGVGEVIVREGETSDELFVVVTGAVRASRAGRNGEEVRLRTLRSGSIIGEIGFLTNEVRSATVTAESDVELRVLTGDAHARLRRDHPDLVIELYDRVLRSTAARAAAIHRSLTQALR